MVSMTKFDRSLAANCKLCDLKKELNGLLSLETGFEHANTRFEGYAMS